MKRIFFIKMGLFSIFFLFDLLYIQEAIASSLVDDDDIVAGVICNVIRFVQRLGIPIMTAVIIGSSIMAIFGRLAWPAIMVLVVFTGIFFGAGKVVSVFVSSLNTASYECPTSVS